MMLLSSILLATLPGFGVQPVATVPRGFISSVVADSHGTLYYTTTSGDIARIDTGQSKVIAHVATDAVGNSGLLGMALRDDNTAIVHYTTPLQLYDVISSIDLTTANETVIHQFVCNEFQPQMGASPEHHGGNPIVASDGSIFVSIGDGNSPNMASMPDWNLGKIFRIAPDGTVQQFARGLRNPFDLAWDAANQRLIAPDNGDKNNDEINIVHPSDDLGWPFTMGSQASLNGTVAPVYVFPTIIAPTGIVAHRGGYLLGSFVTRAIYYIDDIDAPAPVALIQKETDPIVDVTERAGIIYFATGTTIYRMLVPQPGDCNGDGVVNSMDLAALFAGPDSTSWGCDANNDGLIDGKDVAALKERLNWRVRSIH
jgi:hypothetical protein